MSALKLSADEKQFIDAYRSSDAHGKRRIERMLLAPADKRAAVSEALAILNAARGSMSHAEYVRAVDEMLDRICPQPN